MPEIIILYSMDDQSALECGETPENVTLVRYETASELKAYTDAMAMVEDLAEHVILREEELKLRLSVDGRRKTVSFGAPAEMEAYKRGLADADGYRRPRIFHPSDEEYDTLLDIVEGTRPEPEAGAPKP